VILIQATVAMPPVIIKSLILKCMRKSCPGFTLIELLISISIIAVVFGLGVAKYNEFNRRQIVIQATNELKSNLRLTQGRAINGEKDCAVCQVGAACGDSDDLGLEGWYVGFTADSYQVYGQCGGLPFSSKTTDLGGRQIALSSTVNPIWFKPLGLGVEEGATITLSAFGIDETVVVSQSGEIY
jgi:prepilin-type N-terminal cleavage/methylation domain-containing protein